MVTGMITVIIITFLTYFIGSSVRPDPDNPFISAEFPLTAGFNYLSGSPGYSTAWLNLFLVPGVFASCFAFMFAYGRQIFSMSRSGFIPSFLSFTLQGRGTPWVALVVGSAFGFLICLVAYRWYDFTSTKLIAYNCMIIVSLVNYIIQLACFILLRISFPQLVRRYYSPVGIPGAVVGILIFTLCLIAVLGWGTLVWQSILCIAAFVGTGMLYFILYSQRRLILSAEEQFAMLMV